MKEVASLLGQMVFDGALMRFDQTEAAIEMVERQARRREIQKFGQGGAWLPMMNATFATWIDQTIDGDEGGDREHGDVSTTVAEQPLEKPIEAEVLPGAEGDVDIAEATRVGPGDRVRHRP